MPRIQELLNATNNRQIIFAHSNDAKVIYNIAHEYRVRTSNVILAPELENLLLALVEGGRLNVLSLYRHREGPHGEVGPRGDVTCRAVDISAFGGSPVRARASERESNIQVVANLIRLFPADATYDIGFPRPVGGPTGFNADDDVFFPVRDQATAQLCFDGHIRRDMSQMLEPARTRIRQAMSISGGNFNLKFPDGLNHIHIKTYSRTPAQRDTLPRAGRRL